MEIVTMTTNDAKAEINILSIQQIAFENTCCKQKIPKQ